MNFPTAEPDHHSKSTGFWLWLLFAGAVGFAAVTGRSLWIDEALTAFKAVQPDFHGWWQTMLADRASDAQMPLYMVYIWAWGKLAGTSEFALRAANLPWFLAGASFLMSVLVGVRKMALGLVLLLSPFIWYYLDEARPYAMQCGASLMIFAAVYWLSQSGGKFSDQSEKKWWSLFWFAIVCLSGSSLLGMIWAMGACLCAATLFSWRIKDLILKQWLSSLCALLLLVALGFYYLWTLKAGARASDVGKTDVRNLLFIAYELLGFSGLGPGRLQIRAGGVGPFMPFIIPLVIYGAVILDLGVCGARQIWPGFKVKARFAIMISIFLPVAIIIGAGYVKHFRVLGRHFAPLIPLVVLILGVGIEARLRGKHWASKLAVVPFVILSLISCLSLRFATRHAKDDYRAAAAFAKAAIGSGQAVWWCATYEGAVYYHVPISMRPQQSNVTWMVNPDAATLAGSPMPDLVIVSKPEIHDVAQAISHYLHDKQYSVARVMPAFTIWEAPKQR